MTEKLKPYPCVEITLKDGTVALVDTRPNNIPPNTRAPSWQPIETAPKDGTEILAHVGPSYVGGVLIAKWYGYNGSYAWRDWDLDAWEPTAWMPLPPPPE